jgi:hypothetical protein
MDIVNRIIETLGINPDVAVTLRQMVQTKIRDNIIHEFDEMSPELQQKIITLLDGGTDINKLESRLSHYRKDTQDNFKELKNNLGKLSMLWCHVLLFKLNIPFKVVSLFNVVIPDTFNELLTLVLLFNVVVPDTYNVLFIVVIFFNVVTPETFNDDVHVVLLCNVVTPDTFNELFIVVILSNFVIPDTCNELFIFVSILFIVQILG